MANRRKYKKWWYQNVKDAIKNYKNLPEDDTMDGRWKKAINSTLTAYEEKQPYGKDTIQIIYMTLINNTHTLNGAAMVVHLEYRMAKRLLSNFVYDVGRAIGYK